MSLIFVTGTSGFLGSHIAQQLLDNGYKVRAAARPSKVKVLQEAYASFGNQFEVVKIKDIAEDQFPEALKGVDAVIHSAAALAGRVPNDIMVKSAVDGTTNVVRQAEKAGIKRVVVTSSIGTILGGKSLTDQDWKPTSVEMALNSTSALDAYTHAKTLAELELWKFADAHPSIDVTTLNPTFFFGPLTPYFPIKPLDYGALSTNALIWHMLVPEGNFPGLPFFVDIRNVAQAHILALKSPLSSEPGIGRKRLIISGLDDFIYSDIVKFIKEKRPELKSRITTKSPPAEQLPKIAVDLPRLEKILGMKATDFIPLEESLLVVVDTLIDKEKEWKAAGFNVDYNTISGV